MRTLILTIISILLLTGCISPYEEGPRITMRSKKNNLTGRWSQVYNNVVDEDVVYDFQRNNRLIISFDDFATDYNFEMRWRFGSRGDLILEYDYDELNVDVVLLTQNEMVWYDEVSGTRTTFQKE